MKLKKNGTNVAKEAAVDYGKGAPGANEKQLGTVGEPEGKGPAGKVDAKAETETGKGKANGKAKDDKKVDAKSDKKGKAFEAKPIPKHLTALAAEIDKLKAVDDLKAIARIVKRKWARLAEIANLTAAKAFKVGESVMFKKGKNEKVGKVLKVKSNGKVKIDVSGTTWRVPATMLSKAGK